MKQLLVLTLLALAGCASNDARTASSAREAPIGGGSLATVEEPSPTSLGAFSVGLSVKDIAASRAFYEKLGFSEAGGNAAQNWLILRNGSVTVGLFQGMFPNNIMTFNPGWSATATPVAKFKDVRAIQAELKAQGIAMNPEADPASTGPASFMIVDPDGNVILLDQHVPRPAR